VRAGPCAYRGVRELSALLASAGGCLGVRSSGAAAGLRRTAGNRPERVQQVVGERNEQSRSDSGPGNED
jgi:hypothetical protein